MTLFQPKTIRFIFAIFCPVFFLNGYATQTPFEISLGIGPSWFSANDALIDLTPFESDKAAVNNVSSAALTKIGLGYHLPSHPKYFNDLLLELNYYHVNASINGNVWMGGDPNFNNWNFRAPLSSSRLMLDFKPAFPVIANLSAYPIIGAGLAWNKLAYNETATFSGAQEQNNDVHLAWGLNRRISYDIGFGFRYPVSTHLSTSIEYLFNQQGRLSSSKDNTTEQTVLSAPSFMTRSQNVLWNLAWRF